MFKQPGLNLSRGNRGSLYTEERALFSEGLRAARAEGRDDLVDRLRDRPRARGHDFLLPFIGFFLLAIALCATAAFALAALAGDLVIAAVNFVVVAVMGPAGRAALMLAAARRNPRLKPLAEEKDFGGRPAARAREALR